MNLKESYYRNCILSIHRGIAWGTPSNAKPLFLLAIIRAIEEGLIIGNMFKYEDYLEEIYKELCDTYEPNRKMAPFFKPFYHSSREVYYDIIWKVGASFDFKKTHTPSAKYIRENIDYAYLDDGLWELLQDASVREEFRAAIINHYLKEK